MSTHYYVMHAITRNPECGNWVIYIKNHCSSSDKRVQVANSWICLVIRWRKLYQTVCTPHLPSCHPSGALVSGKTQVTFFKGLCTPFADGIQAYFRSLGNTTQWDLKFWQWGWRRFKSSCIITPSRLVSLSQYFGRSVLPPYLEPVSPRADCLVCWDCRWLLLLLGLPCRQLVSEKFCQLFTSQHGVKPQNILTCTCYFLTVLVAREHPRNRRALWVRRLCLGIWAVCFVLSKVSNCTKRRITSAQIRNVEWNHYITGNNKMSVRVVA